METCDVAREIWKGHRRCDPLDARGAAPPPLPLGADMRAVPPPPPAERGAEEDPLADAVGLRGAEWLEPAPGLVRDGAVRGTITGPRVPPPPADEGTTRLLGAR